MPVNDVLQALQAAIRAQGDSQIDLVKAAADQPALADLAPVNQAFGFAGSYILSQASATGDSTTVTLTGKGRFGQPGAGPGNQYQVAATLTYTDAAGFTLTLRVTDSQAWSFDVFFPNLPDCMRSLPGTDDLSSGVAWAVSYLIGRVVDGRMQYPVVVQSPSFTGFSNPVDAPARGKLQFLGLLPEFADPLIADRLGLLSPWPLRISGLIQMPADITDYPRMELTAQGSSTNTLTGAQNGDVQGPADLSLTKLNVMISCGPLPQPVLGQTASTQLTMKGTFNLGPGLQGVINTSVLISGRSWAFSMHFDPATSSLTQGLTALSGLFGVPLPIPEDFPILKDFSFAELDIDLLDTGDGTGLPKFSLRAFGLTIVSNSIWTPPIPFISFQDVGVRWVWGLSPVADDMGGIKNVYILNGSIFGSINLGGGAGGNGPKLLPRNPGPPSLSRSFKPDSADGAVTIDASLQIPSFYINAAMREGDYVSLTKGFQYLLGGVCPPLPDNMNLVGLSMFADPIGQSVQGQGVILFGDPADPSPDQAWQILSIGGFNIALETVEMWLLASGGYVGGGLSGTFYLNGAAAPGADVPRMTVSAEYPPQGKDEAPGWTLGAKLYPGTSIDLTQMVAGFINGDPNGTVPAFIPHLTIDALNAAFTTGTKAYNFAGTSSLAWTPTIFGTDLMIRASASVDISRADAAAAVTGVLEGSFAVNKISIMASMSIGAKEPTYLFKVMFGEIWAQATTSWRGQTEAERRQVVSVQLGGVTLGDILEYLVNLAAPTLGFQLDSPWDLLKRVDLSRFVLTIDPKENVVEFVFNASVDLGVMRVDTVGARYRRGTGQGKVELILTGNFFGQSYGADNPLGWDVINGTPPAVPGQGSSYVDLRYIGIGQRVAFDGPVPDSVAASIAQLRQAMVPPEPGKNPVGPGLKYDSGSQWLLGLDIGLLNTLDLGIIFNDPRLYGLSIGLGGERAGSLAGLRFEILYKKITNDIGMYRIELRVPDAFRTFQLGAASVTLGIVVVEIYTNGDFKVDLGFPYNRDFSRSFTLQAGIFIGRGGFYFGVLDGDTSTSVPKITNGNFSPVIELGIGLAAGVGREISVGILSGGAYVEIEVMFQGVMAWFNPTSSGAAPATFFRAQGVVAIHGKVYGKVDFVVISASVTLEAWAQAMVSYESYRPLLLDFQVGVRAEASVKILFVRISFHFSVTLDLSFTIGSVSQTPWILANSNSGGATLPGSFRSNLLHLSGNPALRRAAAKSSRRAAATADLLARAARRAAAPAPFGATELEPLLPLQWNPSQLVFNTRKFAHLTMLPYVSVADVPVIWDGTPPQSESTAYRMALLLYADTGIAPSAKTVQQTALRAFAGASDQQIPADLLVQALLRYALYALPQGPRTTSDPIALSQLLVLAEELTRPDYVGTGFSKESLDTFFAVNLHFLIGGTPFYAKSDYTDVTERSAMLMPIPPALSWTSTQLAARDFNTYNLIGSAYENRTAQILGAYFPVGGAGGDAGTDDPSKYESFAGFVFRDFCQMVVKAAVTEAQKQYVDVPIPADQITDSATLRKLAELFDAETVSCVREAGDTVQSIASRLGASTQELLFLNPDLQTAVANTAVGGILNVQIGVSPDQLAQDNAAAPLTQKAWPLGDVPCPVGDPSNTLAILAARFNVALLSSLFAYVPPAGSGAYRLGADPNLLRAGAQFAIPKQNYKDPSKELTLDRAAAIFFVRYAAPDLSQSTIAGHPDIPDWYAQTLPLLNKNLGAAVSNGAETVEINPGIPLQVPSVYGRQDLTWTYTTIAGDTLYRIGCFLTLAQDAALLSAPPAQWPAFKDSIVSTGVDSYSIPAFAAIQVEPGETAESLSRRLIVDASFAGGLWSYDWSAIGVWIGPAAILSPLGVITLPGAGISGDQSYSFQTMSDAYGLPIAILAEYLQDQPGLFPAGSALNVRHIPVLSVEQLEQQLLTGSSFAGVVNQSSRMMMSGLRLPGLQDVDGHVQADSANPAPLYDLTGQQFPITLGSAGSDPVLQMAVSSGAGWVNLLQTITVRAGDTAASLLAQYPDLLNYNPGLTAGSTLTVGQVLYVRPASTVTVKAGQTMADLMAQYPDLLNYNPGLTAGSTLTAGQVLYVPMPHTVTVQPGQTMADMLAQYPDLLDYNPGLTAESTLSAGQVLYHGPGSVGSLAFNLDTALITSELPAEALVLTTSPAAAAAPAALPLRGDLPRTYGLDYPQTLQLPQPLDIPRTDGPPPLAGYATLWPFPQSLLALAASAAPPAMEFFAVDHAGATTETARPPASSTYGCSIPFRVQRVETGDRFYTLLGVDAQYRQLLLNLRAALLAQTDVPANQVRLALSPAPNAANAQGLAFLDTAKSVFLVKTNLSTESQPQPVATLLMEKLADDPSPYVADLYTDLAAFLMLLWEGSVVGGVGYYLGLDGDLSAAAFDDRGIAAFTMVVLTGEQQNIAPQGRPLKSYNNCLLVGPGLDASILSLYGENADGLDMTEIALTPPGSSGFTLTLVRPAEDGSKQSALGERYNNLVYECAGDEFYAIPPAWTPAQPTPDSGDATTVWERRRMARKAKAQGTAKALETQAPSPYWRYEQVIPFYRFVKTAPAPIMSALPDPAANPYLGFSDQPKCPTPDINFIWSDLLGNHSQSSAKKDQGRLDLTVGYTDAMVPISQWPELTSYYRVDGKPGAARLTMNAALKSSALLASPSQRGDAQMGQAGQIGDKYAGVYYQLSQPQIRARLSSTLDGGTAQDIALAPLVNFVCGAYVFARGAAQVQAEKPVGKTLQDVLNTYHVRWAELAQANRDMPLNSLFAAGTVVECPTFMPYIAQRSLNDLYAKRPNGWNVPASGGDLFSVDDNLSLPLVAGVVMNLPAATTISTGAAGATPSLLDLSAPHFITPALLAQQNPLAPVFAQYQNNDETAKIENIVTVAVEQPDGSAPIYSVPVPKDGATFTDLQSAFAAQGVNVGLDQIAEDNSGISGLLRPDISLSNSKYTIVEGDTPARNGAGSTAAQLGAVNGDTAGLFDDGALIRFNSVSVAVTDDPTSPDYSTLGGLADRYACPADLLLSKNPTLVCGNDLAAPGLFAWPNPPSSLALPYTARAGDKLGTLCGNFIAYGPAAGTADARQCVAANLNMPGVLQAGAKLTITGPQGVQAEITIPAGGSDFAGALAQAQAQHPAITQNDLADSIADQAVLAAGALLIFPPALPPHQCSPADIVDLYGIQAAAFGLANASAPGLTAPGCSLTISSGQASATLVTKGGESLNALAAAFAQLGVSTNVGQIAALDAFRFNPVKALLPPAPAQSGIALPADAVYPAVVFPLGAVLSLQRPTALIHPDFDAAGPVAQTASSLAPYSEADPAAADSDLTYASFINSLTAALPDLRAGTAKVEGETGDLWCVDFSKNGIRSAALIPGVSAATGAIPRFLALPPLYNHLVSRGATPIKALSDDGTLSGQAVDTNFQTIDVEPWARRFLGDCDKFLSGPFATALYRAPDLQSKLPLALAYKAQLAQAVPQDLCAVLDAGADSDPHYGQGRDAAMAALQQQLGVSLRKAYDTSVLAQYDVAAETPWSQGKAAPTVSLYGQPALRECAAPINFTASKTTFPRQGEQTFVTMFATAADPQFTSMIQGVLDYDYAYTEFDIGTEGTPSGYSSSQWLAQIPLLTQDKKPSALAGTNPGAFAAPIPLRSFPGLPTITEQQAQPGHPDAVIPADLPQWTYTLSCTHEFAAQDDVHIGIDVNLTPRPTMFLAEDPKDLFTELAQYMAVSDKLWGLLQPLAAQTDGGRPDQTTQNAVSTFTALMGSVAQYWTTRLPDSDNGGGALDPYIAGATYDFDAAMVYGFDALKLAVITGFILSADQAASGPGGTWPLVDVIGDAGLPIPLTLNAQNTTPRRAVYDVPEGIVIHAKEQQSVVLAWQNINVSAYQNARARMNVTRNGDLMHSDALPTSRNFILRSSEVAASSIVTPLISNANLISISGDNAQDALTQAIAALFPAAETAAGTTASWGLYYAYSLNQSAGDSPIISRTPVAFYPDQPLDQAAASISAAIQTWTADINPSKIGGGWVFSLVLYSALEATPRPLLSANLLYQNRN